MNKFKVSRKPKLTENFTTFKISGRFFQNIPFHTFSARSYTLMIFSFARRCRLWSTSCTKIRRKLREIYWKTGIINQPQYKILNSKILHWMFLPVIWNPKIWYLVSHRMNIIRFSGDLFPSFLLLFVIVLRNQLMMKHIAETSRCSDC